MSKHVERSTSQDVANTGFPDLTELGRRIELLRIARGLSKQQLARKATLSRQQLWRVMTGKSELTDKVRDRLARSLGVQAAELTSNETGALELAFGSTRSASEPITDDSARLTNYLSKPELLEDAVVLLPPGADGLRIKRLLLNAVEDLALERSVELPPSFFDLRRRVLAGEL